MLLEAQSREPESVTGELPIPTTKKNKRSPRKHKALRPYFIDDAGLIHFLHPTGTPWYYLYIRNPVQCNTVPKYVKKFRRRFRMPHPEFVKLLDEVKQSPLFARWLRKDAAGLPASPIGLLLLGSLRYLGRGLTFDDLEESTSIGEETHRQFLHTFIDYGKDTLYPLHVSMPRTADEYALHQIEYNTGSLNGCGFSADGTHVILWGCQHNLRQAHLGFKESHPARTYNLCCNHRRQILHTTDGHAARWNDKTLAIFDDLMSGINDGEILQDVEFSLYELDCNKKPTERRYQGAWCLTDNGYHHWPSTQSPSKVNTLITEQRLSDWIESFRKDSECVFGILKGRWRVLKTGIRLHGVESADKIWKTCCALHNRLLDVDGLSEPWLGELGLNDLAEMRRHAPFALRRLTDEQVRSFCGRDHENDSHREVEPLVPLNEDEMEIEEGLNCPRYSDTGAVIVNSLSYDNFRARLVEHFDIARTRYEVRWPRRK